MQTQLSPEFNDTREGKEAEAILRKCVHCGFCNATCPTYQLLGDELDGPRGRIYLMKQVLEGAAVTRTTQVHLDRCLTCRACETTCPSGVEYGRLAEIGRKIVDEKVARPASEKTVRWLLREGLTSSAFAPAVKLGQWLGPLLPTALKDKIPQIGKAGAGSWPSRQHSRKVLLLAGCVQPALMPNINAATARVLDAAEIQSLVADRAGCCGAMHLHLNDGTTALTNMRRNIDAWWPYLSSGAVEAIVMNASGCGVTVKEYARSLAHDPIYAIKAKRVSEMTRDLSELLSDLAPRLQNKLRNRSATQLAFHSPCTLQHGQQLRGTIEMQLTRLGFDVKAPAEEAHLCCGSAGAYSVLEHELAYQLRDRKLKHLLPLKSEVIISANIGCIQHLQSGTDTPVKHWIEVLDEALT